MELLPDFRLLRPAGLDEAVAARAAHPAARLVAGGTDLIPNMRRGLVETELLIDLTAIEELRRLEARDGGLFIGAGVTLEALAQQDAVRRDFAAVAQAAASVAGPTHRSMGTVGGNLCLDTRCLYYNQSEWWRASNDYCLKYRGETCHVVPSSKRCYATYSGDLAAALLVFAAEVEVVGPEGRRRLPIADLFTGDGTDYLSLAAAEVVAGVHVPGAPDGTASAYDKIRVRGSIDFPLAGVAVALGMSGGTIGTLRLALTGTDSAPLRVEEAADLEGRAADDDGLAGLEKAVQKCISPLRTTLIQPQYRRRAVAALACRMVRALAAAAA